MESVSSGHLPTPLALSGVLITVSQRRCSQCVVAGQHTVTRVGAYSLSRM